MTAKGRVRPSKPMSAVGMLGGIALLVFAISGGISDFGMFGSIWTLAALASIVYFAINLFSEHGVAEEVIEFDTPTKPKPDTPATKSTEERLSSLEELKQKGLLSDDEYKEQRKKILGDL